MFETSEENDIYSSNESAFYDVLTKIENASANSSSQRDKGTRFETLTRVFFEKSKGAYEGRFTKVQTYKDWVRAHPAFQLNAQDIGIDLVATRAEDGKFAAIQCKFYGQNKRVDAASIDSFITASANAQWFAERIIVATNKYDKWTNHALDKLKFVTPPVQLLTREDLAKADIDWSAYLQDPSQIKKLPPRIPRPYQRGAIDAVLSGFQNHNRGKLIMACGTGKTFTSMKIAEEVTRPDEGGLIPTNLSRGQR